MLEVLGPLDLFSLLTMPLVVLLLQQVYAGNTLFSGIKGGIVRFDGDLTLCNYGSIRESKRSCLAYLDYSGGSRNQATPLLQNFVYCFSERACCTSTYCTGPSMYWGYCLTLGGRNGYVRK